MCLASIFGQLMFVKGLLLAWRGDTGTTTFAYDATPCYAGLCCYPKSHSILKILPCEASDVFSGSTAKNEKSISTSILVRRNVRTRPPGTSSASGPLRRRVCQRIRVAGVGVLIAMQDWDGTITAMSCHEFLIRLADLYHCGAPMGPPRR